MCSHVHRSQDQAWGKVLKSTFPLNFETHLSVDLLGGLAWLASLWILRSRLPFCLTSTGLK